MNTTANPTMNAIGIVVSDMDQAIAFYAHLGLGITVDPRMPDHATCDLPGGLHLMLDAERFFTTYTPGWNRGTGSPPIFLAFQFDTPAQVDAAYATLTGAGHRGLREPWDALWGMRYATVADPDGNGVDLYATLPAS